MAAAPSTESFTQDRKERQSVADQSLGRSTAAPRSEATRSKQEDTVNTRRASDLTSVSS